MSMSRILFASVVGAALSLLGADGASAQRRGGGSSAADTSAVSATTASQRQALRYGGAHRFELVGYGAYRWTFSKSAAVGIVPGEVDIKDSGIWGIALDINTPSPGLQVRLSYDRQDSKVQFRSAGPVDEEDASVEHLQIGAVRGIRQGNILPYGLVSLGGTRYADDIGDAWKFSLILGLGAKFYINDKVGILAQARLPYTFLNTGLGVGVGTGGVSAGITGNGIAQLDLGAGIMILL